MLSKTHVHTLQQYDEVLQKRIVKLSQSVYMSFTQHFAAISWVFSHFMRICSFQQSEYCEIGNVSIGFSTSLTPKTRQITRLRLVI